MSLAMAYATVAPRVSARAQVGLRRSRVRVSAALLVMAISALGCAASAHAATSGLVGAWSFDETSGTVAADSSGSGNDGQIRNATHAAGKHGDGLAFNGTNAFVT